MKVTFQIDDERDGQAAVTRHAHALDMALCLWSLVHPEDGTEHGALIAKAVCEKAEKYGLDIESLTQ